MSTIISEAGNKITGMNVITFKGRRYEWNETFGAYWSVGGEPKCLGESELRSMEICEAKDETTVMIQETLCQYGAYINQKGFITNDEKASKVRVVTKGKRIRIESETTGLLASGPIAPSTIERFVEKFWYWEKPRAEKQVKQA